jgi:hypothetical protein
MSNNPVRNWNSLILAAVLAINDVQLYDEEQVIGTGKSPAKAPLD